MVTKQLTLKKPDDALIEQKLAKVYMVLVEGRGEPKSFHFDVITASQEAKRLAEKEAPKVVSLLQVLCRWQGKIVVADAPLPEPTQPL